MITVNSRRGLMGAAGLGLVVPAGQIGNAEDTLILGIGRKMMRHSVLLGGLDPAVQRTFMTTAVTPLRTTATFPTRDTMTLLPKTIQPTQPAYTAPSYSPMPVAPAPIPDTRVPEPGYDTAAPRPVSPSGATATWTQNSVSPIPTYPPVVRPTIPAAPYVQPSPVDYRSDASVSASNPGDWSYYGGDPQARRPVAEPAGMQATGVGENYVPGAGSGNELVTEPAPVVKTDWLQWAKDNKTTLGVGAAVVIGAIVLLKVIR